MVVVGREDDDDGTLVSLIPGAFHGLARHRFAFILSLLKVAGVLYQDNLQPVL